MLETRCVRPFRNAATFATMALFLNGCLMQDNIEDEDLAAIVAKVAAFRNGRTQRVSSMALLLPTSRQTSQSE